MKLYHGGAPGLTVGGLIADDARVAAIDAEKREVVGWTGAVIRVAAIDEEKS